MASAPLNWLLKIGGDALNTTAQTISAAINELKTAITGKQDTLTFDSTPTENSQNPVTSDGIFDALAGKQNALTFDNAPTENSQNPVTSDGIFNALASQAGMATDGSNAASEVTFGSAFTVGTRATGSLVGTNSVTMGGSNTAAGDHSHAEGYSTVANANLAHAEGERTHALAFASHAEGSQTTASGLYAHVEGYANINTSDAGATGEASHAEGYDTAASGNKGSHAEGYATKATGEASHAEGYTTIASGINSHAEGRGTIASASYSHAGGRGAVSRRACSFVQGNNSSKKFRDTTLEYNGDHVFGIDMSGQPWSSAAEITNAQNGCEGTILNDTTITLGLETQGVYLLVQTAYTISSGAIYGISADFIVAHALETGTPSKVQLKTSTAPTTLTMLANNKISIRNAATTRATQFHLIRLL